MQHTTKFPARLSEFTAHQIATEFEFIPDAFGETFDRFLGFVIHKTTRTHYRVKLMKSGDVRAVHTTPDLTYCDPKLSSGRAKAVLSLFPAFHS